MGFGFGPIQTGLFLYEAYLSGNFSRFVLAEVDTELVRAVRANGGRYTINIARKDRIDRVTVEGAELYNPREAGDRAAIVEAVAASDEQSTALPSVTFYDAGGEASVAGILAEGLARRRAASPTVIYAAENHNRAAEILTESIARHCPADALARVQVLNTVIGKMSGVITDAATIEEMCLATIAPGFRHAVLVEEFNRILISRPGLGGYTRGIDVFIEKDDLLPFEEAKFYGHNAIHMLIGYLADLAGLAVMAEAASDERIMGVARAAFLDESGKALLRHREKFGDPLFTPDGYRAYAADLLERMVRPTLHDLVSRICRDHVRKLAYHDRIYGTMRLALQYDVQPTNLALGAAAGVLSMISRRRDIKHDLPLPAGPAELSESSLGDLLRAIWGPKADPRADEMIRLTWHALERLEKPGAWP